MASKSCLTPNIYYIYTQVYTEILSLEYRPNILGSSLHFLDSSFYIIITIIFFSLDRTPRESLSRLHFFGSFVSLFCNGRARGYDENENQIRHVRRRLFWGEDREAL